MTKCNDNLRRKLTVHPGGGYNVLRAWTSSEEINDFLETMKTRAIDIFYNGRTCRLPKDQDVLGLLRGLSAQGFGWLYDVSQLKTGGLFRDPKLRKLAPWQASFHGCHDIESGVFTGTSLVAVGLEAMTSGGSVIASTGLISIGHYPGGDSILFYNRRGCFGTHNVLVAPRS